MMMPETPNIAQLCDDLRREGYALIEDFVDCDLVTALAAECRAHQARGELYDAAVGRGSKRVLRPDIRNDSTRWFDAQALSSVQARYWNCMHALRVALNRHLLLGLEDIEAHYAVFSPGARYVRHLDRFRDDDTRVVSTVLYLNTDWSTADGGELRLFPPTADRPIDVDPLAGRLALFLSGEIEHEVKPARRDRLSIAGWLRRRV
jgi:SM-20-related protein